MNSLTRPPIYKTLVVQTGIVGVAALLSAIADSILGKSIILGGAVYLLPQAWFAWRVFPYRGATATRNVVNGFYKGEAGKFLLSSLGFAVVFALLRPLNAVALLATYGVLVVVNLVLIARSSDI